MTLSNRVCLLALLAAVMLPRSASAQIDARMLRYPAVSKTQIAFVYAGDIWLVGKDGGAAVRLTSSPGEESFPRFSPDGTKVAYSASYDGNVDVYVDPERRRRADAAHASPDAATASIGWTPDGKRVLFASGRESGRQRYNQFYTVGLEGGLPREAAGALRRVRRATRPTAGSSSTCRCRRTSATGSAIAAAGRRTCGCSI